MNWLPRSRELGDLVIDEVFVDYDGPRVFVSRSSTDQLFLAGWAEEGETEDIWLYMPVSQLRLQMVRTGRWSLRDAFLQPEGTLFAVRMPHDDSQPDIVTATDPQNVLDDWLPDQSFRVQLPTATKPPAVDAEALQRLAAQEGRTRLRIEIEDPRRFRTEASTRRIAALLEATQNVLDNFGLVELEADPAQDGRFAKQVLERMDTDVLELAAASFVIELGATDGDDLLGDSPIARVTDRLVGLLSVKIPAEDLWESLSDLKPRAAKSFRSFVNELAALGSDVTVATANTMRNYRAESLSADQVANLRGLLKVIVPDEIRQIRGRMTLYLGDNERRTFGLRDLFDGLAYEGRVGERAVPQVEHATLGNVYDVVISAYAQQDKGAGETKQKYVLEQLVAAEDETPIRASFKVVNEATGALF